MMENISLIEKVFKLLFPFIMLAYACYSSILHWFMVILIFIIYCFYVNFTSKTVLYYNQTERNNNILSSSRLKDVNFKPYFFLPTAFLQTLFFNFVSKPKQNISFQCEKVNEYGSTISYVSIPTNEKENFKLNDEDYPILIILPGLTGDGNEDYIFNICCEALKNNYNPIIYNNRMLSDKIVLQKGVYLNLIDEFDSAVNFIEKKFPKRKIFALGFSYGANKLLHFLGLKNNKIDGSNRISAAVSISNPFDFKVCQRFLHDTIFDNLLLHFLKKRLRKNYNQIKLFEKDFNFEVDKVLNVKSVIEYDESLIKKILGFKSADDYYLNISCNRHISKIKIPILCVNAIDDNITTSKAIPYDEIRQNDNIILLCTDRGGHLIWIDNKFHNKLNQWINKPVIDYLNSIQKLNL